MDGELLLHTLEVAETAINRMLAEDGDHPMPIDPFDFRVPLGAEAALLPLQSARLWRRHLMYSVILNAVVGLMNVLITREYHFEVSFIIREFRLGRVGSGTITRATNG